MVSQFMVHGRRIPDKNTTHLLSSTVTQTATTAELYTRKNIVTIETSIYDLHKFLHLINKIIISFTTCMHYRESPL